ncbi:2TM domain-containing protein [Zeaxanthinibacter enoshimensis]|uniref:2TM domain-containing protein n=1 Tax=Zeaxanthinibacter enoshimensis TaxID=392009 RepID=A0A4R6TKM8_9FLAO|nr:2TM domain-containing protein [Zeaxanthinibacter enoshimensis]TDQ29402.1 2TM domain-containing protein [Zeaxanthinibacter enoshimensis]
MEHKNHEKYLKAKKKVDELKGFYIHLLVYLGVNIFILANIYLEVRDSDQSFWQAGHFFTLFFWGIGILFHAAYTFEFNPFFGKDWEEKKISKFMEEDKEESKKYQ